MQYIGIAFLYTLIAGLSTGIGGLIAFFTKQTNTKFLSVILGFSAGVMIYISFVEILAEAFAELQHLLGSFQGSLITIVSFFAGIGLIMLIDRFVPCYENPHEIKRVEDITTSQKKPKTVTMQCRRTHQKCLHLSNINSARLKRVGILMAVCIAIHNFPEGFATFVSVSNDPTLGIMIAIAIAIHNIPEGISVSVPIYYATGNRRLALFYSFLSGLAEPLGGVLAYIVLRFFMSDTVFGIVLAIVAGIMVFVSFDELLPVAEEYGEHHLAIYGLIGGMAFIAASMLFI
ncbi:MAG TPA: zinc transporter ZupT [Caldisericia bacterium]|jgi:ZIP family zinc transporter|nr:zinc transporter ZupT [Caldisericia bacterium]HXK51896.1 zinc transporter ZupT [Caldisericia bacterium]